MYLRGKSGGGLFVAEKSDGRIVFEADTRDHLNGWVLWLSLGAFFAWAPVNLLLHGRPTEALLAILCGGPIFLGIPFVAFVTSYHRRLEVVTGVRIRKDRVHRGLGAMRTADIPWDGLHRVVALREAETVWSSSESGSDWSRDLGWRLTAETTDGRVVPLWTWASDDLSEKHASAVRGELGPEEAAAALAEERRILDQLLDVLRLYFPDKLVVDWGNTDGSPVAQ